MSEVTAYLELPQEFNQYLKNRNQTLEQFAASRELDVKISTAVHPAPDEGAKTREPVTVIIASATAIFALSTAITKVIKTINNKPRYDYKLDPLLDAEGNPVKDAKGEVIYKKTPIMLEPGKDKHTDDYWKVDLKKLLFQWSSKEHDGSGSQKGDGSVEDADANDGENNADDKAPEKKPEKK